MSDFWKSLVIAILAPLAVSSFTFASRYGGLESTQSVMTQKLEVIITEQKNLADRVNDMRVVLGTQVDGVQRLDRKTEGVKNNVTDLSKKVEQLNTNITQTATSADYLNEELKRQRDKVDSLSEQMAVLNNSK